MELPPILSFLFYWFITLVLMALLIELFRTATIRTTWLAWGILLALLLITIISLLQCNTFLQDWLELERNRFGLFLLTLSISLFVAFRLQPLIDREILNKTLDE